MRTRKEIWEEREFKGRADGSLLLEILLDIRELLANPSVEVVNIEEKLSRCTRMSCGTIDGTGCGRHLGCRCECHYEIEEAAPTP